MKSPPQTKNIRDWFKSELLLVNKLFCLSEGGQRAYLFLPHPSSESLTRCQALQPWVVMASGTGFATITVALLSGTDRFP